MVPPQANLKTLVNKNAINPKIGGPPQAIFPESFDSPRDFGKKHQVPPGFSTCVHLCTQPCLCPPAHTFINIRHLMVKIPTKITAIVPKSQSWLEVNFYIVRC